ncbi:MAG: hypothetical protein LBQ51_05155, partial [Desulfovibrio sp.]|nr:hypothetical protein [Desulfovibrio sp.]
MTLTERLRRLREHASARCPQLPQPHPAYTLIFSVSDGNERADTLHASGKSFDACWKDVLIRLRRRMNRRKLKGRFLRLDWVESAEARSWGDFCVLLEKTKRGFFRYGLALDPAFTFLLTEQECNANAIFYDPADYNSSRFHPENFATYAASRFPGLFAAPQGPDQEAWMIETAGVFCGEDGVPHPLPGLLPGDPVTAGLYTGHRDPGRLTPDILDKAVAGGARWLARQIEKSGKYVYGRMPCFDRRLTSYNALRHASSTYALLEYLEYSADEEVRAPAERALRYLTGELLREYEIMPGKRAVFLVDEIHDEIKLGGNGVSLLALAKWRDITGTDEHLPLMELLADGITHMQDQTTGSFVHVLSASDLSLKERGRTIYYDGEAVFGLLRLYRHT